MSARKLALATAVLTFALMVLGGVVHATGSSLACPDWPTCYGELMPEMTGGILYEHSHRMLATLVGLCTIALAVWLYREGGKLRWVGLGALVLVVVQGVLGGLTVILRLPPAVSTTHLATAFVFLGVLIYVWRTDEPKVEVSPRLATFVSVALVGVFLQCVLGAYVRHSGAAAACGTDPYSCAGFFWPAGETARIQMLHRGVAPPVGLLVLGVAIAIVRKPECRGLRVPAIAAVVLVAAQIALGVVSVMSALEVVPVSAHLAVGILLFATLLYTRLSLRYPSAEYWAAVRGST